MSDIIVGFTGTQQEPTEVQIIRFRGLLRQIAPARFIHGDCIGSDYRANSVARKLRITTECFPPSDESKRAFAKVDITHDARPYLERNRRIVLASDIMFAMPKTAVEETRSGTWSTVRYVRRQNMPLIIVWPNGTHTLERCKFFMRLHQLEL